VKTVGALGVPIGAAFAYARFIETLYEKILASGSVGLGVTALYQAVMSGLFSGCNRK
jgi:hypothetical protein